MKSHQVRRLLARNVIRLMRVVAFEYDEQLAQVRLGAKFVIKRRLAFTHCTSLVKGGCSPNKPG